MYQSLPECPLCRVQDVVRASNYYYYCYYYHYYYYYY